jgi:hypothetical protein
VLYSAFLLFFAFDVVAENLLVRAGVYTFVGRHPLRIWHFPLWWAGVNSLTPIVIVVLLGVLERRLTGLSAWLVLPVPATAYMITNAAVGWPVWLVLHTRLPATAAFPVGLVSLFLSAAGLSLSLDVFALAHTGPTNRSHRPSDGRNRVLSGRR